MLLHVAIVSEQLLPTVIPCLMARPDRVVLVASRAMAGQARRLQAVLREHGLSAEIHRVSVPDFRIEAIRAYARKLAGELEADLTGAEIVFNATGGTKLMTLGFVEVFRERVDRIIYTDTAHAQIEVIHDRRTATPESEPMPDVLDVPGYLAVQGFRYEADLSRDPAWVKRMKVRQGGARLLAEHAVPLAHLIGALNGLANEEALSKDRRSLKQPVVEFKRPPEGRWQEALRVLHNAGVLQWGGTREIRFPDSESARFLGGGWLEEYAFARVQDARLHDVRIGVTGVWDGATSARNEFDVLACHRNRLLFIECKTHSFRGEQKEKDLPYKVESLGKDTRGLFGEIWLLSAREPPADLLDRAKHGRFSLVGPADLPDLGRRVHGWKQGDPGLGKGGEQDMFQGVPRPFGATVRLSVRSQKVVRRGAVRKPT